MIKKNKQKQKQMRLVLKKKTKKFTYKYHGYVNPQDNVLCTLLVVMKRHLKIILKLSYN